MQDVQRLLRRASQRDEMVSYVPAFQDQATVEIAQQAFCEGTLTLFLGAGASAGMNFPKWDELVDDLYAEVFSELGADRAAAMSSRARAMGHTNATLIRLLEVSVGFPSELRQMLRARLYANYDESGVKNLIAPLSQAFLFGQRSIRHVITLNFDNVLERYLQRAGQRSYSVAYSNKTYPGRGGLRIYHPHGYLPHPDDDPDNNTLDEAVVFSEREYNHHFMDPSHWSNVVQLHHLMNRNCLFVGLSMTDPNLRRLLDHARARTGDEIRHVALLKDKGDPTMNYLMERDMRSLGVKVLWVQDHADTPKVCELIATQC